MTAAYLRQRLSYDPETGALTWRAVDGRKAWNTRWAGQPALNHKSEKGYLYGRLDGRHIKSHRAIFCIVEGRWPEQIDHIDGNRSNNRWANLREVTFAEQARNK